MITIIVAILAIILTAFVVYKILQPKLQITAQKNQKIEDDNYELEKLNQHLTKTNQQLYDELNDLKQENAKEIVIKNSLADTIDTLQKQAQKSADAVYESCMNVTNERLSAAAEKLAIEFQNNRDLLELEYLQMEEDLSIEFSKQINETTTQIKTAQELLIDLESKVKAAIAAAKRQEEMANQQDFYRLQLSDLDIQEIEKLREVAPYLRDAEPLNKVIWKVYYEKPTNDLIGRVVGTGRHTGIYKITDQTSGRCYVGQSVSVAERFKQHIKRGIGAETPTRNKLYPAMQELGVENFTFEFIEECDATQLDAREDYWQGYFGALEFGFSIK